MIFLVEGELRFARDVSSDCYRWGRQVDEKNCPPLTRTGVITMGLAIIAFFTLTDRPATARWLSQEEKDLAIARVKSENVGTTEVLDKLDVPKILRGIFNPNTLMVSFVFLLNNITVQGLAFFLPTIVATIYPTSSTVHKQLMTVPPYVVGAVCEYHS